ncbi:hypothetical protein G7Y89_g6045 [Cudoniella acicularis]|uniref:Uncharacterized protein n=1 Tax=Cudoniella acicularis TaxID=354080 RepID=A0A8H4W552_9HELO|nr:hypothetical protein G7Y89_g6045 [Cudoniella acicularis]
MASSSTKRSFDTYAEDDGNEPSSSSTLPLPKKTRSDADPALWDMISSLPPLTTSTILWQICAQDPKLAELVKTAHDSHLAEEASKPPENFDNYSKDCWHTLNMKYKRMSSSKQYNMMGDIVAVLDRSREAIMDKAGPDTRWETRRNALDILRKISKSIMLCEEQQIRHELMKDGYALQQFADSMLELTNGMTEEEKDRYKDEGLYEKLVDLQNECDWETDMEGLRDVYEAFDGPADDEDEGGEGDDDDEPSGLNESPESSAPKDVSGSTPPRKRVFSVVELS